MKYFWGIKFYLIGVQSQCIYQQMHNKCSCAKTVLSAKAIQKQEAGFAPLAIVCQPLGNTFMFLKRGGDLIIMLVTPE